MRRCSRKVLAAVAVGSGLGLVPLGSAALARPAAGLQSILFVSGGAKVSVGKTAYYVSSTFSNVRLNDNLSMQILRSTSSAGKGFEAHAWSFDAPASSLSFNVASGAGTLDPKKALSPFASEDLTFKTTSKKTISCDGGSHTVYTGDVSGSFSLSTGFKQTGEVKSAGAKFGLLSPSTVTVGDGCVFPPCDPSSWSAGDAASTLPVGSGFTLEVPKTTSEESVEQTTKLKDPKGATRLDGAFVMGAPAPVFDSSTKSLTVKSLTSGPITGTATFVAAHGTSLPSKCTIGATVYKEALTYYRPATYTSPVSGPIEAHTLLTGTEKVAAKGNGFFELATFSKSG